MSTRAARLTLTREERERIGRFLDTITYQGPAPLNGNGYHGITREQYQESYQCWWRGGRAWHALQQGGTGQMAALCWYQHIHRPESREWRPSVIIRALLAHVGAAAA
jgi:hypothetical protein